MFPRKNMEDQRFTIINEGDIYIGGNIWRGALGITSEVDGPYTSEMGYNLTKEETDKLFSIISLEDFIKMVHDGGCMEMTEFFDKHQIKYESHLIY